MIIIGIGANLDHPDFGSPRRTCGAALEHLSGLPNLHIRATSHWYSSAPVLSTDGAQGEQPWYVNGAISITTSLLPHDLLAVTMSVEAVFGRVRSLANSPRTLDLDLVAYHDQLLESDHLTVPHPRMSERAFVILPIHDLASDWKHPVSGLAITTLRDNLPPGQAIESMPDGDGLFRTEWAGTNQNDI